MPTISHTPGPWQIVPMPAVYGVVRLIQDENGDEITRLDSVENDEANARLIAAAPDLLAALCNIVNNFDMGDFIITVVADENHPEQRANLDFAREAIKKATGR